MANLRPPWRKGAVGNPQGRAAPGWRAKQALRTLLARCDPGTDKTIGDRILEAVSSKALQGDSKAAEVLLDRAYPKPKQGADVIINQLQPTESLDYLHLVRSRVIDGLERLGGNGMNGNGHALPNGNGS